MTGATSADTSSVLIAGGGIGGLAAAIALARVGRRVEILEQRTEPSEDGAGIQVGPNGVHALRRLGVADRLAAAVAEPEAIAAFDGRTGRRLARLPLAPRMTERFGAPYWVLRRADLHAALLAEARQHASIALTSGFRVETVEQTPAGVLVHAADGRTAAGAALVGADGLWSVVARAALDAPPPRFSHRIAARALVPAVALPPPFGALATGLWLGPRAHLVHYPVQRGAFVNFVAVVEGEAAGTDWGASVDTAEVVAGFAGWSHAVRDVLAAAPAWRRWSLFERAPLAQWSRGRVAVLGDAAHPVLPFLAQGAVLALEDAVVLADAVAGRPAGRPDDLAAALRDYGARRSGRARQVVQASKRNGVIYHLTGPAAAARNAAMALLPPARLLSSYDWLYGYRVPDPPGR